MSLELFKRLIDEAATLPLIDHVTLTGLGEPLLDKHVIERLHYARKRMPTVLLDLYTNGTYLTKEKAEQIAETKISVLYVSLNAVSAEKRQQVMKLDDYEKVVAQIRYAQSLGIRVIVKAIVSKDLMEHGESEAFTAMWGGPFNNGNGGAAFLHLEGNWAGAVWPMRVKPTSPCSRALSQIMVLWDGRVSLCCFDGEGKVILGDLNKQTIREVFNDEKAVGIRLAHVEGRRQQLELCRDCTAI